jgi:hypothetical protein
MHRCWLAVAIALWPTLAQAQTGISSDLWRVASGTLAEPAALVEDGTAPFWTPAVTLPAAGARFRFGAEAVHGPSEVGVNGGILTFTARAGRYGTAHATYGWIGLSDVAYTETSPEAIGTVPIWAQQASLGLAGRVTPVIAAGAALRYLSGRTGGLEQSQLGVDVGLQYIGIPHVRMGVSTTYLDPLFSARQRAAGTNVGAEYRTARFPLWGTDALLTARYGATVQRGEDLQHLIGAGLALGGLTMDLGASRESVAEDVVWRSRAALSLRSGRYRVQIGRDGGVNAFGPAYRFGLTVVAR